MLKKGLKDLLLHDEGVSALVGPRVRIGRIPEGTSYPVICLYVISPEYSITLQGVNATQKRLVQLSCWAKTPKGADELAKAVHACLNGYRGVLSEGTQVQSCIPCGDVDSDDEQLKLSGMLVDFAVWFVPGEFFGSPPEPLELESGDSILLEES